jgi:hypothetical protein
MLVYVFWHWPEVAGGYEDGLTAFHRRLAEAGVDGFAGSATYRVSGLPWLPEAGGYEDWYLVRDFADLGTLNEAAVSPALRAAHDRPAVAAAGGTGGLYAVHTGMPDLDAAVVSWLGKPRGVSYPDFFASLPATPCLIQRQLTLGPGFEFCALSELPGEQIVRRERVV